MEKVGVSVTIAGKEGDSIVKYSEIVEESYSDHVGTIEVMGQTVQLCDHMQNIDNEYFATTFVLSVKDRTVLKQAGARLGTISDGTQAVYLTEELVMAAKPARENDEMTQAMMNRMVQGLQTANVKRHSKFA